MKRNKAPLSRIAKRMLIWTLVAAAVFVAAYIADRFVQYDYRETIQPDGTIWSSSRSMPIPPDTLAIVSVFVWLIGLVVVGWRSWAEGKRPAHTLAPQSKAQLQGIILRRYRRHFLGTMALYTLVLALAGAMLFLVQKSRIWYATDPLYPPLKALKSISPYAALALWIGGLVVVLYRQWRQSAMDVTGLIDSIGQMQAEAEGAVITVPDTLPEVQPVLQALFDKAQADDRSAREAAQRRHELIAYLAHDLKTPLTSTLGYLELLVQQPEMPTQQRAQYTRIALDKTNRLEGLISQFFEISRYNLAEMRLEKTRLDLRYLLQQLADEFYPILEPAGKHIVLDIPEDLYLSGDADKLARALGNLLRNAAAYGYASSPIHLEALEKEGQVTVSVTNQGKTIPPAQLESIFRKHYRLDDARGSDTGGAGLGLAIAREIVLLHGGDIHAHSMDEQIVFTVSLPKD